MGGSRDHPLRNLETEVSGKTGPRNSESSTGPEAKTCGEGGPRGARGAKGMEERVWGGG